MVVILLNSISIAIYDTSQQHKDYNRIMNYISYTFTAVYVLEACAKIIANGLLIGKGTYLRDPANIFDCVIVWISILQLLFSLYLSQHK